MMNFKANNLMMPRNGVVGSLTQVLPVSGDSMAPEYPEGSMVIVRRINERAFIEWGNVFALDTINGTIIKKLMPVEGDPEKVKCVSLNPEYPAFDLGFEHIRGIYRVVMYASLK